MAERPIAIVVFPDAQVLDVAGPMEILRAANLATRKAGAEPAYAPRIVAARTGAVSTSCGLGIVATHSFRDPSPALDTLIVAGGVVKSAMADRALVRHVRERGGGGWGGRFRQKQK